MFFNLLHVILNCINELAGFYRLIAALQGLFLESPENFSDSRFARGIREICENRPFPRHFLTILGGGGVLYYLIPLGPILVHVTSLRQA